jgi:hypothetical protein
MVMSKIELGLLFLGWVFGYASAIFVGLILHSRGKY